MSSNTEELRNMYRDGNHQTAQAAALFQIVENQEKMIVNQENMMTWMSHILNRLHDIYLNQR